MDEDDLNKPLSPRTADKKKRKKKRSSQASSNTREAERELADLERDVRAKRSAARTTSATLMPGAVSEPVNTMAEPLGSAGPARKSSMSSINSSGHGGLQSQDSRAKNRARRSSNGSASASPLQPGAERVDATAAIMSLESDVQAKNRARSAMRSSSGGARPPAAASTGAYASTEGSQATSKVRRSSNQSNGSHRFADQGAVIQSLEEDIQAKHQTSAGASPGGLLDPAARKASRESPSGRKNALTAATLAATGAYAAVDNNAAPPTQAPRTSSYQPTDDEDNGMKDAFLDEDLNKQIQEEAVTNGFGEANVYHQPVPPESAQQNGSSPLGGDNGDYSPMMMGGGADGGEDGLGGDGIEAFVADNQVIEAAGVAVIASDEEQERIDKRRLRRFMMMGVGCLMLLTAAIVIPVVIVFGTSSDPESTSTPTVAPSNMPSLSPSTSRMKDMLRYAATISDPATLQDETSPQFRAAEWIADDDLVIIEEGNEVQLLQRYVLAVFYFSTGGDNWEKCNRFLTCNVGFSWLTGVQNECLWHGIRCTADNRVSKILIGNQAPLGNNLIGTLPTELADLVGMTSLVLIEGEIGGTIPSEFGTWSNLDTIFIQAHKLTGTIPVELIANGKNMAMLALGNNLLTGPIPINLASLPLLRDLQLWGNLFTGTIPPQLGTLTSTMRNLELQINKLVGAVPESIYNLVLLSQLSLDNNQFTGTISASVGKLTLAKILEYSGNEFTGNIPTTLYTMPSLETLRIGNNKMSGPLSEQLSMLNGTLKEFSVENNDFTGPFLQAFATLTQLNNLILHGTDLTGAVSLPVCEKSLVNLTIPETVDCSVKLNCCDLTLS
mmetsp:Transcript_5612/g.9292  ORF Transcript_5612/g.9292 Transcript_5612/m.9292 type:complete len:839 (-) Transcript_5612:82-2598(-)